ncbi:V-type ATP synthase alpha chain [Frankliniella fusca]|uniref:NADH dehydrogenase [ubiquinone] 1 beta subcomplex subunit 4 n=2 Tax=Arthropoda TaxID=6656 RepID=A0AAE1LN02_9NEOP|nr:V-type ATP synthase alpha chain [Frankliniella fusca]
MLPKGTPVITLTSKEIRAIQDKARERQTYREYVIKEKSNPFRAAALLGTGYINNPAFVRYEAANTFMSEYTYGRATVRTSLFFFGWVIAPIIAIGAYATYVRAEFDGRVRRGEVAYHDRFNKFV